MSWRIAINHRSDYNYSSPAWSSYNEARMTPHNSDAQRLISSEFSVEPTASWSEYTDYWGTNVHSFDLHVPHTHMSIAATAVVDTTDPTVLMPTDWSVIEAPNVANDLYEYLQPTAYTPFAPEIVEAANALRRPTIDVTIACIIDWAHECLVYEAGVTTVHTSAIEAWQQQSGVCQDYAHLAIAAARALGIPARYVSGYFHPDPDAALGAPVIGESHAWIEIWCGRWTAWDPTNLSHVGERHVIVGAGRDYADVTPFKGIFHGGAAQSLTVEVRLTRLA